MTTLIPAWGKVDLRTPCGCSLRRVIASLSAQARRINHRFRNEIYALNQLFTRVSSRISNADHPATENAIRLRSKLVGDWSGGDPRWLGGTSSNNRGWIENHMKIIALEEHLATREIYDAWQHLPADRRDPSLALYSKGETLERLEDAADRRIRAMDDCGVDVQVLSLVSPGLEALDAGDAVAFSRDVNDLISATVRRRPDRFEGFAAVATPDPSAAAKELERAVTKLGLFGAMLNGRIRERNLDQSSLDPVFEAAEALDCPLYIHPQIPSAKVREAYYSGYGDPLDTAFATGGIGWHYETGMQLLRLILAGVLDRYPRLQIIVGHWGEDVLFYLDRIASLNTQASSLKLPIPEYFRRNISVTPSGIFSQRYLRWTMEVVGIERIMFSTDYPFQFAPHGGARAFLERADLSEDDREKVASGNWLVLTRLLRTGNQTA